MNIKTKKTSPLETVRILKNIRRKIQSLEADTNPEAVNEYWNEVCEQLKTIEIQGSIEELHSLHTILKLFAELRGK